MNSIASSSVNPAGIFSPVNPEPPPTNSEAVTTPTNVVSPFALIVPPTPAAPN